MPVGAGTFTVQNKILPGAYINFVSAARADASLSERGIAAMALQLPGGPVDEIFSLTASDFFLNSQELFGVNAYSAELRNLREIFLNAREVLLYRLGANNALPTDDEHADFLEKLESHAFHTVGLNVDSEPLKKMYSAFTRRMRENVGMKIQCVLFRHTEADYEGVISVDNSTRLVPWVTGAQAGAMPGRSLINAAYNGEVPVPADYTVSQLENLIKEGAFVLHRVGRSVRVLEDINTLTTLSAEKNRDFQDNQTIRLIDQISTDIAALFNERYLGKTPNNTSGRVSLWSDIVAHHRQLELLNAIEDFEPEDVTVEAGDTKKSVVVRDCITPVGAMAQLYMTIIVS
jgi:hypothetical protein